MKLFLAAALFLAGSTAGYGQCETKTVLSASKTDHLAADSTIESSADGKVTIEFTKTSFVVHPPDEGTLTGRVDSFSCNWPVPYKVGKTWVKALLTDSQGQAEHMIITIEGKAGTITLYARSDDHPEQIIRLVADTFEEKR
ncbi:MAG TPA: hypothetical protein VN616_09475 [Puia sp.]|nr:hypothetical protein [Puia sp.]